MDIIPNDQQVTCPGCGSSTRRVEVPHADAFDVLELHDCPECGANFEGVRLSD